VQPAEPSKAIDVVVTPTGELNHAGNGTQQPTVPIETSNLAEITHVPSVTTPITTTDGENIVAVEKGVPLTQTAEGLKPIQSSYKVLPSGNVEVKGKDGKMKVLPYTGEEMNIFLSAVGGILSVVSGFVIFKKRKAKV
ncbi:LPXTG cell wall anchor domain-containing protein, partial [Enterococcus faecalis]|uniref:LPXTG cell wall anchor domain-containing protein n=1 Tax=Enterococcus faecalis TaxID=1351 RepID=UPI003D6BF40F